MTNELTTTKQIMETVGTTIGYATNLYKKINETNKWISTSQKEVYQNKLIAKKDELDLIVKMYDGNEMTKDEKKYVVNKIERITCELMVINSEFDIVLQEQRKANNELLNEFIQTIKVFGITYIITNGIKTIVKSISNVKN